MFGLVSHQARPRCYQPCVRAFSGSAQQTMPSAQPQYRRTQSVQAMSGPRTKERTSSEVKYIADDRNYDEGGGSGILVKRPPGFSFGGGPGAVRDNVRRQAAEEILEGGLLELSHREKGSIQALLLATQEIFRDLLSIPKDYEILFIQGGAHAQFPAVPLNFGQHPKAVACVTGSWSTKASEEQKKFARVSQFRPTNVSSAETILDDFTNVLTRECADYGYICTNETMQGVQLRRDDLLSRTAVPIVSDSTSDLLSRRMDISKYGAIFASGGKNIGPAGFSVVIVKKDILAKKPSPMLPSFLDWREYANSSPIQNLYHTPPMVSIGIAKLVLDDLAKRGGVEWAEERNGILSNALYDEIDTSRGFYHNGVNKETRSQVSVVFGIPHDRTLETKFVKQAETRGLLQLVNHPSVGGMRASIYNAVPVQAVEHLLKFMRDFRREHAG